MKISPDCVQQIISVSKVEEVIAGFISLSKNGSGLIGKCPKCNADGKIKGKKVGLTVSIAKGLFKCFSCDFSGKSAVDFLMEAQGKTYPEALLYLADKFHVILEYEQQKKGPQRKVGILNLPSGIGSFNLQDYQTRIKRPLYLWMKIHEKSLMYLRLAPGINMVRSPAAMI